VAAAAIVGLRFAGHVTVEELSIQLAMGMVGLLWIRARTGLEIRDDAISRGVWLGAGIVSAAAVWGLATVMRAGGAPVPLPWHLMDMAGPTPGTPVELPATLGLTFTSAIHTTFLYLLGFAVALPALGSGGALARVAHQFAPPRIQALRRTSALVLAFGFVGIAIPAFLFVALVPASDRLLWEIGRASCRERVWMWGRAG